MQGKVGRSGIRGGKGSAALADGVAGTQVAHAAPVLEPLVVTADEAGRLLGLSPATLAAWRYQGRGPKYVRMGGSSVRPRILYRLCDLHEWLATQVVDPAVGIAGGSGSAEPGDAAGDVSSVGEAAS